MALRCTNGACPDVIKRRLEYFVSKECLDIRGVGPGVIETLTKHNMVSSPTGLYSLKAGPLMQLPGIGSVKAANICINVAASRSQPAWRVLAALGIDGVGTTLSPKLIEVFGSIDNLAKATEEDLKKLDGIGDIMAKAIVEWFHNFEGQHFWMGLKACGLQTEGQAVAAVSDKLKGTKWVITGALSKDREYFEDLIKAHGGATAGSVSKKTTHLIVGAEPGGKLAKAQGFKIPILSEADFWAMIK